MKKSLLLLAFVVTALALFAQNKTISGKITDAATKEPLIGATILVKGTQTGTSTDADGKFTLSVPADAKTITVSFVGFISRDLPVSTTNWNISMEANAIAGQEVVVSSSRVAESIKQASVQIEKMTSREIKSAASGDFYQSISNYKGVDMVTTSAGFKVINLRGFGDTRSLRTKQFIDGVDNEAPGLNFPIGNLVGANDLDLESVEIISGAASSLYGANAMQGVISMRSKNPYDFQGFSAQLKGGGTTVPGPYVDAQIRYAQAFGKSQKFAIKFTGEYTQTKDWIADDDSLNRYGNLKEEVDLASGIREKQYEPVTADFTQEEKNDLIKLNSWLDFNPIASPGTLRVRTPGYMEKDIADYNMKNLKFATELHYRFTKDLELTGSYKFGFGSAVYQATARYQIKNFTFHQPKLELKGKSFFVRAYGSIEDAGDSYNIGLTGSYLSRAALRSVYASRYSEKYFDVLDTLTNGFCEDCVTQGNVDEAARRAAQYADSAWYVPGSQTFKDTFNMLVGNANSLDGTKFFDKSMLFHVEGQYNWDFVKWLDIITGVSYRIYMPNSRGTIFEDTGSVKIRVHEVGAYLQATKRLLKDESLKIIGSIRVDKNSNFKAQVSPRASLVYTYTAAKSDHTFRAGVTSAFRTPTLQDLYLYLDVGRLFLVGNLNGYTNLFTRESVLNWYRTPGTVDEKDPTVILKPTTLAPLKPERVLSVDFGYRTEIAKKVFIDVSAYWSRYSNFIGFQRVVRTASGNANANPNGTEEEKTAYENAVGNIMGSDSLGSVEGSDGKKLYRVYQMWVNATTAVPAWGAAVSVAYYVGKGITPYVNYTYSDLDDSRLVNNGATVLSGFNTPKHKFNLGVNASRVVGGLGFNANFKWVTSYKWQSPFADGVVPSFHTLDLQLYYEIDKAYSTIRLGASNIYNNRHIEAVGSPKIGAMYYVAWSFDLVNFGKKKDAAKPSSN
ncbi:MAG TPA: TonB-dependent receptor [Chitinophagales bacterium]|nr:TonB-dependent receptor [Chitinophagales bacterium]